MKIYVSTYAKYNSGNLNGEWLTLTDYNDAQAFLDACYTLHNDEIDPGFPELMFQDFEDIHKNYQKECIDLEEVYYYVNACISDNKDVIDAGLDCEIPLDSILDAYQGQFDSDSDFAYDMADQCGYLNNISEQWPFFHIDWQAAAKTLMYDYVESNGHYFSNNW
jgi:antirestriction protein